MTVTEVAAAIRDSLDLAAQQEMAFWARWMLWVTVASVALSGIALFAAWRSLMLTRRAVMDTREIGESQTQAYVHASFARFGDKENIVITCKNSGLTPAGAFSINATASIVQKGAVSQSIKFPSKNYKTWTGIGGGEERDVSILEGDEVISNFGRRVIDDGSRILVSGNIVYETVFNHLHRTQFEFFCGVIGKNKMSRPTAQMVAFERLSSSFVLDGDQAPIPPEIG
jgi:hypothetical protein